jgi:hypothetical protein
MGRVRLVAPRGLGRPSPTHPDGSGLPEGGTRIEVDLVRCEEPRSGIDWFEQRQLYQALAECTTSWEKNSWRPGGSIRRSSWHFRAWAVAGWMRRFWKRLERYQNGCSGVAPVVREPRGRGIRLGVSPGEDRSFTYNKSPFIPHRDVPTAASMCRVHGQTSPRHFRTIKTHADHLDCIVCP